MCDREFKDVRQRRYLKWLTIEGHLKSFLSADTPSMHHLKENAKFGNSTNGKVETEGNGREGQAR